VSLVIPKGFRDGRLKARASSIEYAIEYCCRINIESQDGLTAKDAIFIENPAPEIEMPAGQTISKMLQSDPTFPPPYSNFP
jgi:hypothetical protein